MPYQRSHCRMRRASLQVGVRLRVCHSRKTVEKIPKTALKWMNASRALPVMDASVFDRCRSASRSRTFQSSLAPEREHVVALAAGNALRFRAPAGALGAEATARILPGGGRADERGLVLPAP